MKIIIAGAGIGGLTAALCFAKDKHDVVVLEKTEELSEVGAGLQCGANAVRVLNYLGLLANLEALAVKPEFIQFRDFEKGERLYSIELGDVYEKRFGAPYLHIHRADLQAVLLAAVNENEHIQLLSNCEVVGIANDVDAVSAIDQTERTFSGDLLVGCDGIKSTVRELAIGPSKLCFTGNTAWRALLPVDKLPANFMRTEVTNFVGPKKHMVMYYVRERRLLNVVGVVENDHSSAASWFDTAPWVELQEDYRGWHPMVETVVNALQEETCYRWALYEQPVLKSWSHDRVTLLGDAAHATLPFMASGAALAIEDARILQRCLRLDLPLTQCLKTYQKNRLSRVTRVQKTSRKFGTLYHIPNRLLLKTVFRGLGLLGGKKEDFLPEYDANTVPLKLPS